MASLRGGRPLIERMHEVGLLSSGESTGYAGGLNVFESRGIRWVTHGGSWVGYRSSIVRAPGERLSVIALCNRAEADADGYARAIAERLLADKLGPPEKDPEGEDAGPAPGFAQWEPGDLSRFAGVYHGEEAGARCVIDQRGARLVLEGCAKGAILSPGKPGEFVADGGPLTLRFPESGKDAGSFVYWSPGLRGLSFKRIQESFE